VTHAAVDPRTWSVSYENLELLLARARFGTLVSEGYDFQLSQPDPLTHQSRIFLTSQPETLTEPAISAIGLAGASARGTAPYLTLAIRPRTGWYPARELAAEVGLLALLMWAVSFATYDLTHSLERTRSALAATRRRLHLANGEAIMVAGVLETALQALALLDLAHQPLICSKMGIVAASASATRFSGKTKRFADETKARAAALALGKWVEQERLQQMLDSGRPTIAGLVDRWCTDAMPFEAWDDGTRRNACYMMARIKRELGTRPIHRTDCVFLDSWLSGFAKNADQWNKWRYMLVLVWKFACAKGLATRNEGEVMLTRSSSKKLAMNRKVRQPLDEAGYTAIYAKAEPWLQVAMDLSLATFQARKEICNIKHTDFRNGHIFVIRDKVLALSDMAFIKIPLTPDLEAIRARALRLDAIATPFLVHRAPERRQRRFMEGKEHWSKVNEGYLSKAFQTARDASGFYAHLKPEERPTFHEIRGLGGRLALALGFTKEQVRALMTHSNKKTTEIYLQGGAKALTDDHFVAVRAPFSVRELLKAPPVDRAITIGPLPSLRELLNATEVEDDG